MKIYMVSLGCAKNQVDSEMILGTCKNMVELCDDPSLADLILINTCAFIESARKEAIDTILSLSDYKNAKRSAGTLQGWKYFRLRLYCRG